MSREIKFRIMYKKYPNIWLKDEYTLRDLIEMDGAGFLGDDDIIEQYTGLRDKNGKEIYEGDVVKWLDGLGEYIDFRVEWQDNRARFCLRNEYSVFDYEDLNDKKKPYIEIIGNIHENPELLEETS